MSALTKTFLFFYVITIFTDWSLARKKKLSVFFFSFGSLWSNIFVCKLNVIGTFVKYVLKFSHFLGYKKNWEKNSKLNDKSDLDLVENWFFFFDCKKKITAWYFNYFWNVWNVQVFLLCCLFIFLNTNIWKSNI